MNPLHKAAQQTLEALESSRVFVTSREKIKHPEGTEWYDERIAALRAALAQQDDWTRCHHCGQTMPPVPLGQAEPVKPGVWMHPWPPVVPPVLAQQDEPAQEPYCYVYEYDTPLGMHRTLYPKEHNGKQPDRAIPLYTAPPKAEPVEPVAWVASKDGRVIYDDASTDDGLLRVSGDFENDEQRSRYAQRIVDKLNAALAQQAEPVEPVGWNWMLDGQPYGQAYYGNPPDTDIAERAAIAGRTVRLLYTAPPQRKPLTEEEIGRFCDEVYWSPRQLVRAVERAHGIKG